MKQLSKQIILLKPPGYNLCDRITKKKWFIKQGSYSYVDVC